jgi:hypothetical protein
MEETLLAGGRRQRVMRRIQRAGGGKPLAVQAFRREQDVLLRFGVFGVGEEGKRRSGSSERYAADCQGGERKAYACLHGQSPSAARAVLLSRDGQVVAAD